MKRILFQGDSITDANRRREDDLFLGSGYPVMVAGSVAADHPGDYEFLNRAVSGFRVVDLYATVKRDIINLKPDILSILVGINDIWHEVAYQNGVDAVKYEKIYNMMLDEIRQALPNVQFVILEPFVLLGESTCPSAEHPERWERFREETPLRAQAAKRVAEKHGAVFVPLQERLNEACKKAPESWWLRDGVHPTVAGHELIARAWLEETKNIIK